MDDFLQPSHDFSDRFLNLIDLDHLFVTSKDAKILNHLDLTSPDFVKKRNDLVFARSGELDFITHCDCYDLKGNINRGLHCAVCGTICRDDFSSEDDIEHNLWLSVPSAIHGVLHPVAYMVLSNWLKPKRKGAVNYLDVIVDPTIELPPELQGVILDRGHNYLFNNFDFILHHFLNVYPKTAQKGNTLQIEKFIKNYRAVLFCTKLPVMSSVMHSITSADGSGEGRKYADAASQAILDAAINLASLESRSNHMRQYSFYSTVQRIYKTYIGYLEDIAKNRLSRKPSLIRRHMLGTRLHFSFRAVIIPHMDRYDEIYLPWAITVNLLKPPIIGRLMDEHSLSLGEAVTQQIMALMRYDPMIDEIMKRMIAESPFPGLPCLINRNPSLRRGAIQLLYVTKIKTDIDDNTMNISTLVLKDPNAKRSYLFAA